MHTLITGATGLVGQQLSLRLLKKGHKLTIIGRSPEEDFRQKFSLPCDYLTWDQLEQIKVVDNVIHLAGDSIASARWSDRKKKSIVDSRINTAKKLIETFKKTKQWPKLFLTASAIGIYGNRGDEELSENSKPGTGFLADVCSNWEAASQKAQEHCRYVQLRIGLVFDHKGGFLEKMEGLFSKYAGGPIGSGNQWMSWIHINDLLGLIEFSIDNEKVSGPINATAPNPTTNKEWTKAYAETLKVVAPFPAPPIALKIVLGEMSALALDSQKVMPQKALKLGYTFQFTEVSSALADLYQWKNRPQEKMFSAWQWFPESPETVFSFFSEAKNLEKITPPYLNFKVTNMSTSEIKQGTLIDYKLSLHGLPLGWRTEITNWSPIEKFTDNQLTGPYKRWFHTHAFYELAGGTLMTDEVIYELPMGLLGQVASGYVRKDVSNIFAYRKKTMNGYKF